MTRTEVIFKDYLLTYSNLWLAISQSSRNPPIIDRFKKRYDLLVYDPVVLKKIPTLDDLAEKCDNLTKKYAYNSDNGTLIELAKYTMQAVRLCDGDVEKWKKYFTTIGIVLNEFTERVSTVAV